MANSIKIKNSSNIGQYKVVGSNKKYYTYAVNVKSVRFDNIWHPHLLKVRVHINDYHSSQAADQAENKLGRTGDLPDVIKNISHSKYKFTMADICSCKGDDFRISFFDYIYGQGQRGKTILLYVGYKGKYRLAIQIDFWGGGKSKVDCFGLEHDDNGLLKIHRDFINQLQEKGKVLNCYIE